MSEQLPLTSDLLPHLNCTLDQVTINKFNLNGTEKTLVSSLKQRFNLSLFTFIEQSPEKISLINGIYTNRVETYRILREKILAEYETIKKSSSASDAYNKLFLLSVPFLSNINENTALNIMGPLSEVQFNLEKFEPDEKKVLVKIKRKNKQFALSDMLVNTHQDVLNMHGIGTLDATIYARIKHKIIGELHTIINSITVEASLGHYSYLHGVKSVGIKEKNSFELDAQLVEQFEEYLFKLDTVERKTLMSYYGFQSDIKTLDEIGHERNLTRESIRQKLISSLERLKSEALSNDLLSGLNFYKNSSFFEINGYLPSFSNCFTNFKRYGEILAFLLNLEKKHFYVESSNDRFEIDLSGYFANYGIVISTTEFSNYLLSEYFSSAKEVEIAIEELIKKNKIKVNDGVVSPLNLNRIEAAAALLVDQPYGLPLKDIARIINAKGLVSGTLSEHSSLGSIYSDSDYIYQCDRGTYKHQNFLPTLPIDLDKLFDQIKSYMRSNSSSNEMYLSDFYSKCNKEITSKLTYFEFRHYIRKYSITYDIKFLGKSGVDALYIGEDSSGINQENFVLELFSRAKKPLMLTDVAGKIRSKSAQLAGNHLNALIDKNKLVMLDHMRYTTPEIAFRDVDAQLVMSVLQEILKSLSGKPCHFNFIKGDLNKRLNRSYTKYFYEALAYYKRADYPIYLSKSFVSLNPIPFKSTVELLNAYCNKQLSTADNFELIKLHIHITYATFLLSFSSWLKQQAIKEKINVSQSFDIT